MKSNIKVLDCTLRDGGYINNWDFGVNATKFIITQLYKANIDCIELGFLSVENATESQTIFNSVDKLKYFIPNINVKNRLFGMITYDKYPIDYLPDIQQSPITGIRVIFKKNQIDGALEYCKQVKQKGYKLFINPTFIDQYSDKELLDLIQKINKIFPCGMAIVDSMGTLRERDIIRLSYIIDNNLHKDIAICFHSHNNLQLSFPNAQCLIKSCQNRELIIDSTVFGMGRGAGNLCTELITQYINDNHNGQYNLIPILKIVDELINTIFIQSPWGYSVPYYLAATNHCHPNYAKYLVDKQTVSVETINSLLNMIPTTQKATYDSNLIKHLYLDKLSNSIDDKDVLEQLSLKIKDKNILLLGPGKTLKTEGHIINNFISEHNPYTISLNFIPKDYKVDLVFITNIKRFDSLLDINCKVMLTSNIKNPPKDSYIVNYYSYLNDSAMYDNVVLMLLKLFEKINIKQVYIAGLDGFSTLPSENYIDKKMVNNARIGEFFDERNQIMSAELAKISKNISINFITKTKYQN